MIIDSIEQANNLAAVASDNLELALRNLLSQFSIDPQAERTHMARKVYNEALERMFTAVAALTITKLSAQEDSAEETIN